MTANPHPLADDPLAFEAFEKIRRVGVDRADGQTFTQNGSEYGITAHRISTISTVHVILETLQGKGAGHQRAMVIVTIGSNGYRGGPDGQDFVLRAMRDGVKVDDRHGHNLRSHHVLPWVAVPAIFIADGDE